MVDEGGERTEWLAGSEMREPPEQFAGTKRVCLAELDEASIAWISTTKRARTDKGVSVAAHSAEPQRTRFAPCAACGGWGRVMLHGSVKGCPLCNGTCWYIVQGSG